MSFSIPDLRHAVDRRRHLESLTEEWVMSPTLLGALKYFLSAYICSMPTLPAWQLPCLLSSTLTSARPFLQLGLLLCLLTQLCGAFKRSQFSAHYLNRSLFIAVCALFFCLHWSPLLPLYWSLLSQCCVSSHTWIYLTGLDDSSSPLTLTPLLYETDLCTRKI